MEINLELQKVIEEIKAKDAKSICIQLPDGLKPKAKEIQDAIKKEVDVKVLIWAGSCFGACDVPSLDGMDVDLLIQWGHSIFKRSY